MRKTLSILSLLAVLAGAVLVWSRSEKRIAPPVQEHAVALAPVHAPLSHPAPPQPAGPSAAAPASEPQEPVAAFASWLRRYRSVPAAEKVMLMEEGEKLARQRRPVFYQLIAKDPAAALAASVDEPGRTLLPESILALLEHPASARGDLSVIVDDSNHQGHGGREVYRQAGIDGQSYDAYVYGRRANQQTKYGTSLIGVTLDDRMAVLEEPVRLLSAEALPPGAVLEKPVVDSSHTVPVPATGAHVVQAAGKYFPVCCDTHAQEIAARWVAAEDRPGPQVQALGQSLPGMEAAAAPAAQASSHLAGPQTVLVMLVDFPDAAAPSVTSTILSTQTADFYTQASYNKTTIGAVTVTGVLHMTSTLASYSTADNTAGLKNDVLAKATTAGFTPANFDRQMVVFSSSHGFQNDKWSWAGLAELGGSFIWINGSFQLGVLAHEVGHTYGLSHAKLWQIPGASTDPVDPAGMPLDYGDPFDIMGGAIGDAAVQPDPPNPWYLNNLGWLPDSAVQTVDTNNGGQAWRVYRFDHQNAAFTHPLALRVNRNEGTDYWISYRRKYAGYPGYSDMGAGAYVFWATDSSPSSDLIDIDTPGTNAKDASLNVGSTFTDTAAGVTLQVVAAGGTAPDEYLDVKVAFQSRIAFAHKINNVDEAAGSVTLTVNRLNSGTGAVSAHYTTVNGTAVAGTNFTATAGTLNWADGDMSPRTIVVPITVSGLAVSTTFTVNFDTSSGCVFPSGSAATVNIQKTGTSDSQFLQPFLTSRVNAVLLQPDGKILVGGNFEAGSGGVTSAGLIRLEHNGTIDTSFDQGVGVGPLPDAINVMARQPDGKILVAGGLTTIRGVARNKIARLLPNGSLDVAFDAGTGPNDVIHALAVQPDGKILVGGDFTTWNGVSHIALVRLTETGGLDAGFASFQSQVSFFAGSERVAAITLQPSATAPFYSILVGGLFYRNHSPPLQGSIIRLAASGVRDATFSPGDGALATANSIAQVSAIAVQPDGKVLVGGQFKLFNGVSAGRFARLTSTGANDAAFVTAEAGGLPSTQGYADVLSIKVQPDGGILTGGFFEKSAGVPQGIARFKSTGARDALFNPAIENWSGNGVQDMDTAADNTVVIGLNNAGDNPLVMKRLFTGVGGSAGVVEFSTVTTTAAEGTAASLTVDRTGGASGKVSINYQTVARSAVDDTNFTAASGTLTWQDGDSVSQTINIPTVLDAAANPDLVFEVHLGVPVGGVILGARAVASVTVQDVASGTIPQVNFAAASSSAAEGGAPPVVTITLSKDHADTITVPFTVTGTATSGKDYTLTASSVTFAPGDLSQPLPLSITDDALLETNETLIFTLKTPTLGTAFLGNVTQHTLTILDNEAKPSFTTPPVNVMASVGTAGVTFHSVAAGNPVPAYQWLKNGVKITGATSQDYSLSNLQLTHAGQYSVTGTNGFGIATAIAQLGVVDTTPKVVNVVVGTTATLTATTGGNLLSYAWTKGGVNVVSPPRITASAKSLIIKTANVAADAGTYVCNITNPGGTPVPVTFTLNVIDTKPTVTNTGKMDDGIVSGDYHYAITVNASPNLTPTSYSATGLPAGLLCNAVTGVISGKPTVSTKGASINVTLKATNGKGTGSVVLPLMVADLAPNTAGTYMGPINRNAGLNFNLGGRIDFTVTATGAYTGSLTLGPYAWPFKGALNTSTGSALALGDTTLTIASKASCHLTFTIDPASGLITSGGLLSNGSGVVFTGWHSTVPPATATGYQTFSIKLDNALAGNTTYPQGLGYGSFTVPATTAPFAIAGVLADGTAFTSSSTRGPLGQALVYQCIYGGAKGSVLGQLTVAAGVPTNLDSTTAGALTWCRPPLVGRLFAPGFIPIGITAEGGRIDATRAGLMTTGFTEKTGNAALAFTLAGVGDDTPSPDVTFTLKKGGLVTVPGLPNRTTVAFTAATGLFSGTFLQTTPARTGTYKGILVKHAGTIRGDGWFTLPQLIPTPTTSVIFSGQVQLNPVP